MNSKNKTWEPVNQEEVTNLKHATIYLPFSRGYIDNVSCLLKTA